MAIYHLSSKVIGRSSGRSATAAAAYRSAERIVDQRTGLAHDYTRRRGDISGWITAPGEAPEWTRNRQELWDRVETAERRKDAQVAREVEVALPTELSRKQQDELVAGFAREQFAARGMVADVNVHRGDGQNPHAHILLTTRALEGDEFGAKNRDWNRREMLERVREAWARDTNRELERAGYESRVDHRSNKARGVDKEPTKHEGPAAREMEQRGVESNRMNLNRQRRYRNQDRDRTQERRREASKPSSRDQDDREPDRDL